MVDGIFERMGVNLMKKVLNISSQRQKVIAGNIANSFTPGYVKKELIFEENLAKAMDEKRLNGLVKDRRHIPIGNIDKGQQPMIIREDAQSRSVDIDKEMAASAENQIYYATVVKLISGKFKSLRMCIRGRT